MSTDREIRFQELLELKEEKIKALEEELKRNDKFIFVQKPSEHEERMYRQKIAELSENSYFQYYFACLQHQVMNGFSANPEYTKGQMSLISVIMHDSSKARDSLNAL